jgi:hypothetical protein
VSGNAPKPEELEFPVKLEGLDEESTKLYDYLKFKLDPATGKMLPRDLSQTNPVEAVEILRTLRQAAEFHRDPPSKSNLIARKLYTSLGEILRQQLPDVAALLEKETALIIVRDAAQRMQEKYEAELGRVNPLVYAGIAVALYLVSMAVGSFVLLAVGAAATLFAFWRSVLCRTWRAALCAWLAELLEGRRR